VIPNQDVEISVNDHCSGAKAGEDRLQESIGTIEFLRALAQLVVS